jgi:pyruvate,water dikinase
MRDADNKRMNDASDTPHTPPVTVVLGAIEATDPALVGPKMVHVDWLRRWGAPVPEAFCITTEAFKMFLELNALASSLAATESSWADNDDTGLKQASQLCRQRLLAASLPNEIELLLNGAYRALAGTEKDPEIPVAVRSSASGEDSKEASFAGQYESFLNIQGPKPLANAVRQVWASLFSERAMRYRRCSGTHFGETPMAVIVMSMVPAYCAGVAFSADPVTGKQDRIIIEGCWGYGEAVVQGVTVPDRIAVDKEDQRILDYTLGSKQIQSSIDPSIGAVREIETDSKLQTEPCLTSTEVIQIATEVSRLERQIGTPVDAEWVLTNARELFFVQLRPITALPDPAPQSTVSTVRAAGRWHRHHSNK